MLSAFKVLLCSFSLLFALVHAEDHAQKHFQLTKTIKENNKKILNLKSKLKGKNLKSVEKKQFQAVKDKIALENFKNRLEQKIEQKIARRIHAKRHEKIELKYLPKGVCKNPCTVNLEAIVSKKSKALISKYIFYIDDSSIESTSTKLATTIFFAKSMLTDKQKKLLTKNIPLHKVFKLRVEGIISETKMLESETKKLVLRSLPSNLTNIELISNNILPYNKIQISTSGISSTKLQGTINNIPLSFEVDPTIDSSQILYTLMPYLTAGRYKLNISNFSLDIQVSQMPIVSNPVEYVNNLSNGATSLSAVITDGDQFKNILSSNGIALFSKFNEVVTAFDNYIKNEATPGEIQDIANIINSSTLGDSNVYFFVKNDRDSIRDFIKLPSNRSIISKIISVFIDESYAQESPQNSLKQLFMSKVTEAIKFSLTLSFNTIIDGMINKCYVSKGRTVPASVVSSEFFLVGAFGFAVTEVIANQALGAYAYYSTITAAQALVILIGNDCEGDSTIIPKLVIQTQPLFPINPGESFQYDVKCDVGDSRYYAPGSILTRVTSQFDYISNELSETGDLIARDKLVHSCSGIGFGEIQEGTRKIFCNTNLLEETSYYQQNSKQYEELNISQCSGNNDSYDVGTYLVSNPDLSCNFVNIPNNVNIPGPKAFSNQLVFDLSKEMQCPPKPRAIINYTKNKLVINFNSADPEDPEVSGLTYNWNFGDGQTLSTQSKSFSHTYSSSGNYNVSLTVTNSYGVSATTVASIQVQGDAQIVCENTTIVFTAIQEDQTGNDGVVIDCGGSCSDAKVIVNFTEIPFKGASWLTYNKTRTQFMFWDRYFSWRGQTGMTYPVSICHTSDSTVSWYSTNANSTVCGWELVPCN